MSSNPTKAKSAADNNIIYLSGLWVLAVFYISSLTTFTMIYQIGWLDKVFAILRYLSYLAMALLSLWFIADQEKEKTASAGNTNWIRNVFSGIWEFLKTHILFDVFFVISLISCYFARVIEPALLMLLFLFCSNYKFKDVCKVFVWSAVVLYILTLALSTTGAIENLVFLRYSTVRYSLGFIYPLETHSVFFFAALAGLYAYYDEYGWKACVIVELLNILLYYFTRSRFSFLMLTIIVILFWLNGIWHKKDNRQPGRLVHSMAFRVMTIAGVLVLFILPNLISIFYNPDNGFLYDLNQFFNDRFLLGFNAYRDYTVNPFGSLITWIGFGGVDTVEVHIYELAGYNYVDISYIKNLFDYGWVYMLGVMAMYIWAVLKAETSKNWQLVLLLGAVLGASLFEARLLQISVNIILPFAGQFFLLKNSQLSHPFTDPS